MRDEENELHSQESSNIELPPDFGNRISSMEEFEQRFKEGAQIASQKVAEWQKQKAEQRRRPHLVTNPMENEDIPPTPEIPDKKIKFGRPATVMFGANTIPWPSLYHSEAYTVLANIDPEGFPEIWVRNAIMDTSDLVIPYSADGTPHPEYPLKYYSGESASEEVVDAMHEIAQNPDYRFLSDHECIELGAPLVIYEEHMIIAILGPNLAAALEEAYQKDTAEDYQNWLYRKAKADNMNLDRIRAFPQPIYVRMLISPNTFFM